MSDVSASIIERNLCPVCGLINSDLQRSRFPDFELHCARCGNYDITHKTVASLLELPPDHASRPLIAGWIWEQNLLGVFPKITTETLPVLLTRPQQPYFERAKRLLIYLAETTKKLGSLVSLTEPKTIQAMLQTFDLEDIGQIARFLEGEKWVVVENSGRAAGILGHGFIKAEEWKQARTGSTQGFVAMWFDPSMDKAWSDGISIGI
jgi:hypothetical protein